MPSQDQHHRKAAHNRQFLQTISLDDYPDWVVERGLLYCRTFGRRIACGRWRWDSTAHEDRMAYVQARHSSIHTAYHILQNASMLARYQANSSFFKQFQRDLIADRLVGRLLPEIEVYVELFVEQRGR